MSALKYISKIVEAIQSLSQNKMTQDQARKALEKNSDLSKQELDFTFPNLQGQSSVTKEDLLAQAQERSYTLTPRPTTGEAYQIYDEFHPRDWDSDGIVTRDGEDFVQLQVYERVVVNGDNQESVLSEEFEELLPIRTPSQRATAAKTLPTSPELDEWVASGKLTTSLRRSFTELDPDKLDNDGLFRTSDGGLHNSYAVAEEDATRRFMDNVQSNSYDLGAAFSEYVTPGPKTNYQETPTTLDLLPPNPDAGTTLYREPHFNNDNVAFHTRSSTRTPRPTPTNPEPKPVLYGEEVQSQWAQENAEAVRGHRKQVKAYDEYQTTRTDLLNSLEDIKQDALPKFTYEGSDFPDSQDLTKHHYLDHNGRPFTVLRKDPQMPDPETVWKGYVEKTTRGGPKPPSPTPNLPHGDNPYQKNWENKALNSLLAEAVDKDLPGLALSRGKDQTIRYPYMTGKEKSGLEKFYDEPLRNELAKIGKRNKSPLQELDIITSDDVDLRGQPRQFPHPSSLRVEDELWGPILHDDKGALPDISSDDTTRYQRTDMTTPELRAEATGDFDNQMAYEKYLRTKQYEEGTSTSPYLEITPAMRAAIKKGLPLSVLGSIGASEYGKQE